MEPNNDHEQLLDDWLERMDRKEADHSGCIRFAWVLGSCGMLLGFIAGHIHL